MSISEHEQLAHKEFEERPLSLAVITVSDSRTPDTDTSGDLIVSYASNAGHRVDFRAIVPDEPHDVREVILAAGTNNVDAILLTGGTGISKRDGTVDVVRAMSSMELEGFGERFRALSFDSIGTSAMLSRACAVIIESEDDQRIPTFSMPGSNNAVSTAMEELVIPIIPHLVWECRR